MLPFLQSRSSNSIKQGDGTVNRCSKTQWNWSTIFMKLWGCIHTYFFTSAFPWNQCWWKWGAGNKNTFSWKAKEKAAALQLIALGCWAGACPAHSSPWGHRCLSLVEVGLENRIPLPCGRASSTLLLDPGTSPGLSRASSTPGRERGSGKGLVEASGGEMSSCCQRRHWEHASLSSRFFP